MNTKYSIVKKHIKSKIQEGLIQPHQKIGSESELMKQFELSRHTVRKAIDDLVNEGWIYKKQGAGSFCADRSLSSSSDKVKINKNIAVIVTYFNDYIFPTIIRGMEHYLSSCGYNVSVFSTNNDIHQERRCLENVIHQKFDGLIVEPTKSALPNRNIRSYLNIEKLGIPYVMLHAYYDELDPYYVVLDDETGGYIQAKHVMELNHTEIIGFFKNDDIQGIKRMKGFIKAHREQGLPLNPSNIITYTTETKKEYPLQELRRKLTEYSTRPTAIVCYNDELVIWLLDIIRELQLRVPRDISIVGFDNSFLSVASEVKVTTIHHPQDTMGYAAGKVIHQLVEQKNISKKCETLESVVFKPELIMRQSTNSPKSNK
ncbi:GntR family transcriptional regulator [Halalkalibacter sp. AB-rgal2]|uniref:GntR family transcriptional regulator n=1 Tax=Halalkalibacter sp. AB-rgal2 TaxID=3242695 RepID=UPI00359F04CB